MINIKGTLSLECSQCKHIHNFSPEEVDFTAVGSEEKGMGPQVEYNWEHEYTCDHDSCDCEIAIDYSVWEYPVGSFNDDSVEIDNGTAITKFSFDFDEKPEPAEQE